MTLYAVLCCQIGQVSATDDDEGQNARLTYSLPDDMTALRIDAATGKVYVKAAIDRETTPRFEFSVHVSDSGVC